MDDLEMFALYIIRKKIYFDCKNKIDRLETQLASLMSLIQSSKIKQVTVSEKKSKESIDLMLKKDFLEEELKELYDNRSMYEKLYLSMDKKIMERMKMYEKTNNLSDKNKKTFYLFYYRNFVERKWTVEQIAIQLDTNEIYLYQLKQKLDKELQEKIKQLSEIEKTK